MSHEKPVKMALLHRQIIMIFDKDHISSILLLIRYREMRLF